LIVDDLAPGKPVAKALKAGDRLVSLNGVRISSEAALFAAVDALSANADVTVVVTRAGKRVTKTFATYRGDDGGARLGVHVASKFRAPMPIKVQLADVGGPSAGLALTLAIVDQLTPGNMTDGKVIAVTGEIDAFGSVGAIGGLPQKIASAYRDGARTMLIPADNCQDVPAEIPSDMKIIPVSWLDEAISALDAVRNASEAPHC